jgi:hypothetical protein
LAKGEYIAIQNSDDLWTERHLEELVEVVDSPQCEVAFCDFDFFGDEKLCEYNKIHYKKGKEDSLSRCYPCKGKGNNIYSDSHFLENFLRNGYPHRLTASLISRKVFCEKGIWFEEGLDFTDDALFINFLVYYFRVVGYTPYVGLLIRKEEADELRYNNIKPYEILINRTREFYKGKKMTWREKAALNERLFRYYRYLMVKKSQGKRLPFRALESMKIVLRFPGWQGFKAAFNNII